MTYDDLTIEDFTNVKWLDVLQFAQTPHCSDYDDEFAAFAKTAFVNGEERNAFALKFMSDLTSIQLTTDDPHNPFKPQWVFGRERSASPEDLSDTQLVLIRGLLKECIDPELNARMSDILWVREKDYSAGLEAVEFYLTSAERLKTASHLQFDPNVKRAIQLAAMLEGKREKPLLQKCRTFVEQFLKESIEKEDMSTALGMIEILFENRLASPEQLCSRLETITDTFIDKKCYHQAHTCLRVLEKCLYRARKDGEVRKVSLKASALLELQAKEEVDKNQYSAAADYLKQSIGILHNLGQDREDLNDKYSLLEDYQQKSIEDLKYQSKEILKINDKEITEVKAFVSGRTLFESLYKLSLALKPMSPEEAKEQYDKTHEGLVFHRVFGKQIVSERGAVVGIIPPYDPNATEEDSEERSMMQS